MSFSWFNDYGSKNIAFFENRKLRGEKQFLLDEKMLISYKLMEKMTIFSGFDCGNKKARTFCLSGYCCKTCYFIIQITDSIHAHRFL